MTKSGEKPLSMKKTAPKLSQHSLQLIANQLAMRPYLFPERIKYAKKVLKNIQRKKIDLP